MTRVADFAKDHRVRLLQGAQAVHGVADRLAEGSRSLVQNTAHFHLQ